MARKGGLNSLWSGSDRVRIGERFQASLAGIVELEMLRHNQGRLVQEVLALHWDRAHQEINCSQKLQDQILCPKLDRSKSEDMLGSNEKSSISYHSSENLSTKRLKDVYSSVPISCKGRENRTPFPLYGNNALDNILCSSAYVSNELLESSTHADHNEKLGETLDNMDSDSRPSSGFYEVSETGSSLSNSCTSVYSECLAGLRSSLHSLSQQPVFQESSFVRPRSTDEAAVRMMDLQLQRLLIGKDSSTSNNQLESKRPLSTGDIEFIHNILNLGDVSSSFVKGLNLQLSGQCARYQSDLISRNTNEVYPYPSPLHAVALQSPLFTTALSQNASKEDLIEGASVPTFETQPLMQTVVKPEMLQTSKIEKYISKLVLKYKCRAAAPSVVIRRSETNDLGNHQKSLSLSSVCSLNQYNPVTASQLISPASGWKIRRRISTCCQAKSSDGPEGTKEPQILDGSFSRNSVISDTGSTRSSVSDVSKVSDFCSDSPVEKIGVHPKESNCNAHSEGKLGYAAECMKPLHHVCSSEHIQYLVRVRASSKKYSSLRLTSADMDRLYKGKHASRELIKTSSLNNRDPSEKSVGYKMDIFKRISLRKKADRQLDNGSRSSSEMNLNSFVFNKGQCLYKCESQQSLSESTNRKSKGCGQKKGKQQKWTSVLEISSKNPDGTDFSHNHNQRLGFFGNVQPFLSHHRAFSTDCPSSFHSAALNMAPSDFQNGRAICMYLSDSSLGEFDASSSSISLNGEWIHNDSGITRPHQSNRVYSATLDPRDMINTNVKFYRARSFKGLKKRMCRSIKPFSFKGNS
ncbi:dapper homolog 2-like isoform X1 [Protopterus annectens]|uniref:dapper homolog 2-like isoform X1 n=2 Tax=Protopterus annectens TaxID=7888 RepID=UPI001CF9AE71|nr:dapper homolog 2-like isoform X1 [Protopterus annectens]